MLSGHRRMGCGGCGEELFRLFKAEESLVSICEECKSSSEITISKPKLEINWTEGSDGVLAPVPGDNNLVGPPPARPSANHGFTQLVKEMEENIKPVLEQISETDKVYSLGKPVRERKNWAESRWAECDQCSSRRQVVYDTPTDSHICSACVDLNHLGEWMAYATRLEEIIKFLAEFNDKLAATTFGSPEFIANKAAMRPTLEHHYARNRHHPEHHKNGVDDMNLLDVIEMLVDWKASSERHNDGNILKSIEINSNHFHISPQLRRILENTAKLLDGA